MATNTQPTLLYKSVLAVDVKENRVDADLPVYYRVGNDYHLVEYMSWHTEGVRYVGGTLDIEAGGHDYEIDRFSKLYLADQASCTHCWERRENNDIAEDVCTVCGKRVAVVSPVEVEDESMSTYKPGDKIQIVREFTPTIPDPTLCIGATGTIQLTVNKEVGVQWDNRYPKRLSNALTVRVWNEYMQICPITDFIAPVPTSLPLPDEPDPEQIDTDAEPTPEPIPALTKAALSTETARLSESELREHIERARVAHMPDVERWLTEICAERFPNAQPVVIPGRPTENPWPAFWRDTDKRLARMREFYDTLPPTVLHVGTLQ